MSGNVRFWRYFALIGLAHVVLVLGLVHWGNAARPAADQSIVWMSDPAAVAAESNALTSPIPEAKEESEPVKESAPPVEEEGARGVTAQSEIQLPTPEPSATPKATPQPVAKAVPRPSGKPKPKPTPKPKPSAKPIPKKMLATATPKPKPTLQEKKLETEPEKPKPVEDQPEPTKPATSSVPTSAGNQGGSGGGGGKSGSGGGAASRFGWYGNMLHDRFYSEWAQPTTTLTAGAKVSALVKVRIEKDGRVSSFEIVRSSGNPVVDDSITAMGKRVTQVDPLPAGLGNGEHYDVKINFELNAEQ